MSGSNAAAMKECAKILTFCQKHRDSGPFREPVLWKEWGLHDYPEIIKHPMDLSAVQRNLENGVYNTPAEFAHDMRLIWNNCMTYNQDGSDYYNLAAQFSKMFEEKFEKIKASGDGSTMKCARRAPPPLSPAPPLTLGAASPPTLEEKTQFSQSIYKISSEQLGRVVQILDDNCPKAIEKTSTDEIEVNIDAIDTKTFRTVEQFVLECLPQGAAKGARKKKRPSDTSKAKKARTTE